MARFYVEHIGSESSGRHYNGTHSYVTDAESEAELIELLKSSSSINHDVVHYRISELKDPAFLKIAKKPAEYDYSVTRNNPDIN